MHHISYYTLILRNVTHRYFTDIVFTGVCDLHQNKDMQIARIYKSKIEFVICTKMSSIVDYLNIKYLPIHYADYLTDNNYCL